MNDYVGLCKDAGKELSNLFKGGFNVRINSELHSKAFEKAIMEEKPLNQFVKEAIEHRVEKMVRLNSPTSPKNRIKNLQVFQNTK